MTDRHKGYIVTLAADIREDDAEAIINALRMVRGVLTVEPIVAGVVDDIVTRRRVENEYRQALLDLLQNGPTARSKT